MPKLEVKNFLVSFQEAHGSLKEVARGRTVTDPHGYSDVGYL